MHAELSDMQIGAYRCILCRECMGHLQQCFQFERLILLRETLEQSKCMLAEFDALKNWLLRLRRCHARQTYAKDSLDKCNNIQGIRHSPDS